MIEFFYRWYIALTKQKVPGRELIYKFMKLFVNVVYPWTVWMHRGCGVDKNSDVILSVTSFPARIKTVYITIDTLLCQTMKPNKVILYLADSQFPNREKDLPGALVKMRERGLEIKFCDDLRSHKKYYYAMLQHPDKVVITTDDDMYYSSHFVAQLYAKHQEYPNAVVCNWGHEIQFDEKGEIKPYLKWKGGVSGHTKPSMLLSPVGAEGVLYPSQCADAALFDKTAFRKLVPYADDLWLKMMCVRKDTRAVRAIEIAIPYFNIASAQKFTLQKMNVTENMNDSQLHAIFDAYPEILEKLKAGENG